MSSNLVNFRVNYLKAIARAWQNENKMVELFESDNIVELFAEDPYFEGTTNPWPYLKITSVPGISKYGLPTLTWQPTSFMRWVGPDDIVTITLPTAPEDPEDFTIALAEYYRIFPSLLGQTDGIDGQPPHGSSSATHDVNAILDFGALMLKAIGEIWSAMLAGDVTKDNWLVKQLIKEYYDKDISPFLNDYFGFNNPWNMKIKLVGYFSQEEAKGRFTFNPVTKKWDNIIPTEVQLYFPSAPEDKCSHPIALADYNTDGSAYPFSCT